MNVKGKKKYEHRISVKPNVQRNGQMHLFRVPWAEGMHWATLISFRKRDKKLSDLSLENNVHCIVATTAYLSCTVRTAELDNVERMQCWLWSQLRVYRQHWVINRCSSAEIIAAWSLPIQNDAALLRWGQLTVEGWNCFSFSIWEVLLWDGGREKERGGSMWITLMARYLSRKPLIGSEVCRGKIVKQQRVDLPADSFLSFIHLWKFKAKAFHALLINNDMNNISHSSHKL